MGKQPETHREIFKRVCNGAFGDGQEASDDYLFHVMESYRTECQKIEAQQVAGMSLEECRKAASNTFQHYTGKDYVHQVAKMYASACVAEKGKECESLYKEVEYHNDTLKLYEKNIKEKTDRIQELESRQEVKKWISVEDRLPDNDAAMLVCVKQFGFKYQAVTFYKIDNWIDHNKYITHWMPLPNSPDKK